MSGHSEKELDGGGHILPLEVSKERAKKKAQGCVVVKGNMNLFEGTSDAQDSLNGGGKE